MFANAFHASIYTFENFDLGFHASDAWNESGANEIPLRSMNEQKTWKKREKEKEKKKKEKDWG